MKQNEFEIYIEELNKLYMRDKNRAIKEAHNSLYRLGYFTDGETLEGSSTIKKIISEIGINNIFLGIMIVFILLIGLVNIKGYGLYIFGFLFFIAGYFVALKEPKAGIIFLFSHGATGLGIMTILGLFGGTEIFNHPIFTDNPVNIYILAGVVGLFFILGTLVTILYNLSITFRHRIRFEYTGLLLYSVSLMISAYISFLLK